MQKQSETFIMKRIIIILAVLAASTVLSAPIGGLQIVVEPAFRMPAGSDSFKIAELKEMVDFGDFLKTGSNGFLGMLYFEDGSILKLSGNSEAQIVKPETPGAKRKIYLKVGDFWAKVNNAQAGLEVETPSSTASIKGTEFWILVSPNGDSRLICEKGIVEFINKISGKRMFVAQNQICFSGVDGSMTMDEYVPQEHLPPESEPEEPETPQTPQGSGGPSQPQPGGGQPSPKAAPSGGGLGLSMNGAVGASVIDGQTYQYISLRPDISIWRFGIGLDLPIYFDSEGKIREEDWDEGADIIDKIYYLRYGKPGNPLYVRVGSLSPITLGYGLIMKRYTNAIEWPQVRRTGMQMEMIRGNLRFEGLVNNFRELDGPGLLGGRLSYEFKTPIIPVVAGGTFVIDGNQYLGIDDDDNDGVPDRWDMFPGKNDNNQILKLNSLGSAYVDSLIEWDVIPDITNPPPNLGDSTEAVTEWGIDVGVPLIRGKLMNLWIYGQMAAIVNYGTGFAIPGVQFNLGPFRAGAEYRIFQKEFMGEFFDMAYETERVVWSDTATWIDPEGYPKQGNYITKSQTLASYNETAQGIYAEAGLYLFNIIDVFGAYQKMSYGGDLPTSNLYARAALNTSFIPKVSLAEAYYHQPNADKIFTTDSNGTVLGWRVGFEVGSGVSLIYDNRTIYYNGEPEHIITVETAITF